MLIVKKGDRFAHLTVVGELDYHVLPSGTKRRKFLVECDCGNMKEVLLHALVKGATKSCGCLVGRTNGGKRVRLKLHEYREVIKLYEEYGESFEFIAEKYNISDNALKLILGL